MTVKALTIAGSDPSGGAGVQADLKAFSANGAYGMTVLTALTAQNTQGVTGVHAVPVSFVAEQLDTLLADITPDATKIGMLATAELADLVGSYLPRLRLTVLDPVMVATSGDRLLDEDAVDAIRRLLPLVDLITPNLHEAAVLLDEAPASSLDTLAAQAERLVALGARRALVKGGHLDDSATDLLADAAGVTTLTGQRIATANTHGTGCTLSSAIAALRPQRPGWGEAVADAKAYLTDALKAADTLGIGHGHGPVHHFVRHWS
ncbi:MAG: bifunctional hydroxymethylpyrimidine kinase/phosphomethylpyrimidine kinase [Propionibacteriaceae bacterium]|nr:bifunctional hydroxymethylpyrimidine kinase/phosphomethylpyrimidine kinase [Propionibacteriaceae bacterium]